MSLNNSLSNGVNETRTDNCEGLSPGRRPTGKQRGPGRHQNTARKRWTKKENKTVISCYLKAANESKRVYRKRMYDLWNEVEMFQIEQQHLACQVRSIFKNKRLTEIEIKQLRKEIEKAEIVPDRVNTVSEMSYAGLSGTETVREQCCDLEDYPGDTTEDHIENPIHQRLIEIMHEGAKRDTNLLTKYKNEVKKVPKCISVRNSSDLKYAARASALLACEKVGVKTDYTIISL